MTDAPPTLPDLLRLGVTGHRDLADAATVDASVVQALNHVEQAIVPGGAVTRLRWIVVSPLAAGADRVVARAVLRRDRSSLEVITPFALEEYEKDFTSQADHDEFRELLNMATLVTALPGRRSEENEAYLQVGKAVVDQCDVLVAVWDGEPAAGRGGTGDVVQYAVEHGRPVLWIDSDKPQAPAVVILVADDESEANGPIPRTRIDASTSCLAECARNVEHSDDFPS